MPTRQRNGRVPADASANTGASSHIRLYLGIASVLCLGAVYISHVSQPDTSNLQNIYRPHEEEVHRYLFEQSNSKGSSKYILQEHSNPQVSHGEDNNQHRRQMLPSFDVIQKAVGASKSVLRTKQMAKSTQNDNSESATLSPSRISLLNIFSYRNAGGGDSSSKLSKSKSDSKSKSSSDSKKEESSKSKSSDSKSKSSSKSKSDSKSKKKEGSSDDEKEYDAKSKTKKYGDVFQDIVDDMMEDYGKGKGKGGGGAGGHYDEEDDEDYSDSVDDSKQDGGKGKGKGSSNGDDYSWNQDEKYDDVNYEWTVFGKGKGGSSGGYSTNRPK